MRALPAALLLAIFPIAIARADPPPPSNAKPLSEVLQTIEKNGDFAYFDEVEWDHGTYQVEYYTKSGTKVKIYIDPVTGERRP